jgi:hypothetical protein
MSDYQDKHIATRNAYCQRLELGEGKLAEHTTGERSMINFGFAGKAVEEGAYRLQRSYAPLNDENYNKITTFQEDVLGRSDVLWDFYRCVMQKLWPYGFRKKTEQPHSTPVATYQADIR